MIRTNQGQICLKAILLLILFWILSSCHQKQKFDKAKWLQVEDLMTFPNRNLMINDLIKNYYLKRKSFNEIIQLLGQPQYSLDSTLEMGYKIEEEFGNDIDPVYIKTLLIHFDKDTLSDYIEIKEFRK